MPSDQIGGISFIGIVGGISPQGEALTDITRPGVSGVAFKKIGMRSIPVQATSVADLASAALAKTHIESCVALRGTYVTYYDSHGNAWNNIVVIDVQPRPIMRVRTPSGGLCAGEYICEVAWTLQHTEVT